MATKVSDRVFPALALWIGSLVNLEIHCSGTLGSFNNFKNGKQDFGHSNVNSGSRENKSSATGTRDSFNNYGMRLQNFSMQILTAVRIIILATSMGLLTPQRPKNRNSATGTLSSFFFCPLSQSSPLGFICFFFFPHQPTGLRKFLQSESKSQSSVKDVTSKKNKNVTLRPRNSEPTTKRVSFKTATTTLGPKVSAPQRQKNPKKLVVITVITVMVLASVFCNDVNAYYKELRAGESGITHINRFDASKFLTRLGSQIRWFSSEVFIDDCVHYQIVAGKKALEIADLGGYRLSKEDYQALKKRKLQEHVGDTSNGNIDGVEDDTIENGTFERGEDNITAEHGLDHQEKLSAVGWPKKGRIDVVEDDTIENDTFERCEDNITAKHGLDHQEKLSVVGWPKKGRIDVVEDDTIENGTFERGGDDITAEHGLDHQEELSAVGWPKKGRIDVVEDDTIENDTFERGKDDITAEHGLDHQEELSAVGWPEKAKIDVVKDDTIENDTFERGGDDITAEHGLDHQEELSAVGGRQKGRLDQVEDDTI